MLDDAEGVLRTYQQRNSDNPNSHRYLYEFYVNHGYGVQLQLEVLQVEYSFKAMSQTISSTDADLVHTSIEAALSIRLSV